MTNINTHKNIILFNKKKTIVILIISLLFESVITLLTVSAYQSLNLTNIEKRLLQCSVYMLLIIFTMIMIKCSGHSFKEVGLFKRNLSFQCLTGFLITGIFLLLLFMMGWRPHTITIYSVFSFMLVAISEELFSRGFVLRLIQDLISSDNWAVLIQAIIFGLLHFPIQGNVGQVISTFFIALIYGAMRVEFSETLGIPAFATAHWLYDLYL